MSPRKSDLPALSRTLRRRLSGLAVASFLWLPAAVLVAAPTEAGFETATDAAADAAADGSELQDEVSSRSGPPAPLGIRFGEALEDQRFRIAYSFERMKHRGLLVSDGHVSQRDVLNRPPNFFDRTPRTLEVTVHTFQLAYAPHPRSTLIIEVPFVLKELETMDEFGRRTEEQTKGVGDIGFILVVPFIRKGGESSQVHVGFDIPTGSIRRGGSKTPLPFDSQIGNGTVDVEWGWTYRGEKDWLAWGAQVVGRHPIGRNGRKYREGSRFETSVWGAATLSAGVSASLRFGWRKQNNTRTQERDFVTDPLNDPSDDPKARGGTRLTLSPGLTLEWPRLGNQRISVEVGIPVYQNLDGPQLEQDWSIKAGWQWGF